MALTFKDFSEQMARTDSWRINGVRYAVIVSRAPWFGFGRPDTVVERNLWSVTVKVFHGHPLWETMKTGGPFRQQLEGLMPDDLLKRLVYRPEQTVRSAEGRIKSVSVFIQYDWPAVEHLFFIGNRQQASQVLRDAHKIYMAFGKLMEKHHAADEKERLLTADNL